MLNKILKQNFIILEYNVDKIRKLHVPTWYIPLMFNDFK